MSDEIVKSKAADGPEDEDEDEPEEEEDEDDEEPEDEDDGEAPDTAAEFRYLFMDAKEQEKRLKELAARVEQSGDAATASIYREIAGNVLTLLGDTIASAGHAIATLEMKVEALESDRESFLTEEDAREYLTYFAAAKKIADDVLKAIPDYATAEREAVEKFLKATDDRIDYTKGIGELDDEAAE